MRTTASTKGRFDGERWYSSTGEFVLRISGERMYLSNGTFEARMQGNRLYKANGEYIGRMQDDRFLPGQWRIHRAFGWGSVLRCGWALLGPNERRKQSPRLLVLLQTSGLLSEPPERGSTPLFFAHTFDRPSRRIQFHRRSLPLPHRDRSLGVPRVLRSPRRAGCGPEKTFGIQARAKWRQH